MNQDSPNKKAKMTDLPAAGSSAQIDSASTSVRQLNPTPMMIELFPGALIEEEYLSKVGNPPNVTHSIRGQWHMLYMLYMLLI